MGLSVYSALKIQGNSVKCQAGGPCKEKGKYTGWIMNDVDRWDPILNTESIYDTKEEAVAAMETLVKEVRELDLGAEEAIKNLLGDDLEPVKQVVQAAKGEKIDVTGDDSGRPSGG